MGDFSWAPGHLSWDLPFFTGIRWLLTALRQHLQSVRIGSRRRRPQLDH